MKLEQGQVWKKGAEFYRITAWARMSIEYKLLTDLESKDGTRAKVSKKEFCRLIKGADLLPPVIQEAPAAAE